VVEEIKIVVGAEVTFLSGETEVIGVATVEVVGLTLNP
jgi:hypothetical protein